MGFHEYLAVLRKRWVSVLVVLVTVVSLSVVITWLLPPRYTSTTEIYFAVPSGETVAELAVGSTFTEQQMSSYARVATSPLVLDAVIDDVGLDTDAETLARSLDVSNPPHTAILVLSVEDEDPQRAAEIATSLADELSATTTALTPDRADGTEAVRATVLKDARAPESPSSPNLLFNIAIGIALGLMAAVGLAFLRESTDTKLRSSADVEQLTGVPVLGTITYDGRTSTRPLFVRDDPQGQRSEAVRRLRTNMRYVELAGRTNAIVVTSSLPGEGKSTTAINLAVAFADAGRRVALVDADLRRPAVAGYLGIEGNAGLTTVLIGRAEVDDVVQRIAGTTIDVLPAGPIPPNPSELLGSDAMAGLLEQLTARYDTVLLDSAPLLPVTDAAVLSRQAAGTLVVAGSDRVHKAQLRQALGALERVDSRVLGIVLNKVRAREQSTYSYSYRREEQEQEPAPSVGRRGQQAERIPEPRKKARQKARQEPETVAAAAAGNHRARRRTRAGGA